MRRARALLVHRDITPPTLADLAWLDVTNPAALCLWTLALGVPPGARAELAPEVAEQLEELATRRRSAVEA